jgi:hypothetical protein
MSSAGTRSGECDEPRVTPLPDCVTQGTQTQDKTLQDLYHPADRLRRSQPRLVSKTGAPQQGRDVVMVLANCPGTVRFPGFAAMLRMAVRQGVFQPGSAHLNKHPPFLPKSQRVSNLRSSAVAVSSVRRCFRNDPLPSLGPGTGSGNDRIGIACSRMFDVLD